MNMATRTKTKTSEIVLVTTPAELAIRQQAGQAANQAAAGYVFEDHTGRKAANTKRRQQADLELFESFLAAAGVPAAGLYKDPRNWQGLTWGIVQAFVKWQLDQGYAIASINSRLSTVRVFAKMAAQAGAISPQESILIASVKGYAHKEEKHINEARRDAGQETRKGAKKAEAVIIPDDAAEALKTRPHTP